MIKNKNIFLTSLLCVLLIFSNLIRVKEISIFGFMFSSSIIVYPFTFLCVLLITYKYGYKEALKSVLYAFILQILFYILSIVMNKFIIDNSVELLNPSIKLIVSSLLAFSVGELVNIFFYVFSIKYVPKVISIYLTILLSLVVDVFIFLIIMPLEIENIGEFILNQYIIRFLITIVLVILFSLLTIKKKYTE